MRITTILICFLTDNREANEVTKRNNARLSDTTPREQSIQIRKKYGWESERLKNKRKN